MNSKHIKETGGQKSANYISSAINAALICGGGLLSGIAFAFCCRNRRETAFTQRLRRDMDIPRTTPIGFGSGLAIGTGATYTALQTAGMNPQLYEVVEGASAAMAAGNLIYRGR